MSQPLAKRVPVKNATLRRILVALDEVGMRDDMIDFDFVNSVKEEVNELLKEGVKS